MSYHDTTRVCVDAQFWQVYKEKGWNGFGDWLGTGRIKNPTYLVFEDSKKLIHNFQINPKTEKMWRAFCRDGNKPLNIPYDVAKFYKTEWKGWADFLGKVK